MIEETYCLLSFQPVLLRYYRFLTRLEGRVDFHYRTGQPICPPKKKKRHTLNQSPIITIYESFAKKLPVTIIIHSYFSATYISA